VRKLWGRMLQNVVRGGEKSKAGEKGDGRCYFPCQNFFLIRPVRILIETTTNHCRKYGHIDGRLNEYHHMVISYIFIIFFYFVNFMYIYFSNVCYNIQ
jgi:hypothetical protein